ncbi:MAG: hypothetical protein CMJ81_18150 [Planctomycetaceae bacterium]|nr:hypothetical protein [Planctomycetaceae bacterium]
MIFGVTPDPDFAQNRQIYVCYNTFQDVQQPVRVSRLTLDGGPELQIVPGSEEVIISWPAGPHSGGCLQFGPDGYLYISTGDGWGPNPPDHLNTGQDLSDLMGAILRIDVHAISGGRPYRTPTDNPFISLPGARPEIWAYGLRNPWKFAADSDSGDLWVADNGWESWESIHRVVSGSNCGWPIMEGRAKLRSEVQPGPTPIIPPVKDHSHTEANSVIGGVVYRGAKLPDLNGYFVYGDYIIGKIWAVRGGADQPYAQQTLVDTDLRITAFAEGSEGELYVVDYDLTGQIYELLPSNQQDTSQDFPRKLSETGLFESLQDMQPQAGIVGYDVQVSRWTDGSTAQRWVAIPGAQRITLPGDLSQQAVYPEGTVFVKNLILPQGRQQRASHLETQILHYEGGTWRPYSYLWDATGEEAHLVGVAGAERTIQTSLSEESSGISERTWRVNSHTECRLCHNPGSHVVLGFTLPQLNRSPEKGRTNQLALLKSQGVLSQDSILAHDTGLQLVRPDDQSQDLEDRARSYLHANCSMCHHPRGNAIVNFYLRRDLPFSELNTSKGTIVGEFGIHDPWVVIPGNPYRSLLVYRMSKLGYARMPYIGSRVVDSDGVALVADWVRSLEHRDSTADPDSHRLQALRLLTRPSAGGEQSAAAIDTLLSSTEGALALVVEMHRGALKAEEHQRAVELGNQSVNGDIRGLFEAFIPEAERQKRLGPNIDPADILQLEGDDERGKLIFFSDAARCRNCHPAGGQKDSLGPDLREIGKKVRHKSELLDHILKPSFKIEDKYVSYAIVTDAGKILSGLILERTESELVFKTIEKKVLRLSLDEIDEINVQKTSLMPEFLLRDLTPQEAADLLSYLWSFRTD